MSWGAFHKGYRKFFVAQYMIYKYMTMIHQRLSVDDSNYICFKFAKTVKKKNSLKRDTFFLYFHIKKCARKHCIYSMLSLRIKLASSDHFVINSGSSSVGEGEVEPHHSFKNFTVIVQV